MALLQKASEAWVSLRKQSPVRFLQQIPGAHATVTSPLLLEQTDAGLLCTNTLTWKHTPQALCRVAGVRECMATCRGTLAGVALVKIRGARAHGCVSAALLGAPQGLLPATPNIYVTTRVQPWVLHCLMVLFASRGLGT